MDLSIRVLKEPRGFIRVLQCILAILAFSTTVGFSTMCKFNIPCTENGDKEVHFREIEYGFGYPFEFKHNILEIPESCDVEPNGNDDAADDFREIKLPFDFSNSAEFFVATGVMTFLYCILILFVYIFFHQTYSNNPKVPVIDLIMTALLTIFWLSGSSAWAQGVSDLKYYLHPDNLFGLLCGCQHDGKNMCTLVSNGEYATLNVSLIFGFACFLIWLMSIWFIYKETIFHTPAEPAPPTQNQTVKNDIKV